MVRKFIAGLFTVGAFLALGGFLSAIVAPQPAEARLHRSQVFLSASASAISSDAGFVGAATFGHTWTWYASGTQLGRNADGGVANPSWPITSGFPALGGWDAGTNSFVAYQSSGTMSTAGLGDQLANQGVLLQGQNWYNSSGMGLPQWTGSSGQTVMRIIFRVEPGASATLGYIARLQLVGVGELSVIATDATRFSFVLAGPTAQTYTVTVTPPFGISTGDHILDVWWTDPTGSGAGLRPNLAAVFDGVYMAGAENTADITTWVLAADALSIGSSANNANVLIGRTVFFIGAATNADAAWYDGFKTSYEDCVILGLCPDPNTGASAGANRTQLCGDAGLTDSNYAVCTLTVTADGRARGSGTAIAVAANYRVDTPADLYLRPCGCTYTGATCRGTLLQGGNTTEPNIEVHDYGAIVLYLDPVYTDSTDCGGGLGWLRNDTITSDYQLQYVDAMISYARSNYNVGRTFCVGRSNGAAFCEWLAGKRPGLLSGIASTIGYLPGTGSGGMGMPSDGGAIPYLGTHSSADPTVYPPLHRVAVSYWLNKNLGLDAGDWTGFNPANYFCLGTDGGGLVDGNILTNCGCGGAQSSYDGGVSTAICCDWNHSQNGDIGPAVRYCESSGGGHAPVTGEGEGVVRFLKTLGEDAGG